MHCQNDLISSPLLVQHKGSEDVAEEDVVGDVEEKDGSEDGVVFGELIISPDNISPIHYVSWLAGIILACLFIVAITIIPHHNPIYEPYYYWEFTLYASFCWVTTFVGYYFGSIRYGANFHFGKNVPAFIFIWVCAVACYIILTLIYHLIWVTIYGFYAPMPMTFYVPGSFTGGFIFALGWVRYTFF